LYKEIYHTKKEFSSSTDLPLSWTNNTGDEKVSIIQIGRKNIWLNGGSFNSIENFTSSIKKISKEKKVIIRGCNQNVLKELRENGFNETLFAKEAIIELNKEISFSKKAKRRIGSLLRRGTIREVSYSEDGISQLENFTKTTIHCEKPKLKNLFLDNFSEKTRLFIYEIIPNQWEGAILLSKNSTFKIQGEQFYRKKDGINGIMDVLVYRICQIIKDEGYSEFSLGEVPFVAKDESSNFSKTNILSYIGRKIKFVYNHEGLYYFKDKFATRWDDIFICTNRKLRFYDIFKMAKKSNLLSLTLYKIFN